MRWRPLCKGVVLALSLRATRETTSGGEFGWVSTHTLDMFAVAMATMPGALFWLRRTCGAVSLTSFFCFFIFPPTIHIPKPPSNNYRAAHLLKNNTGTYRLDDHSLGDAMSTSGVLNEIVNLLTTSLSGSLLLPSLKLPPDPIQSKQVS